MDMMAILVVSPVCSARWPFSLHNNSVVFRWVSQAGDCFSVICPSLVAKKCDPFASISSESFADSLSSVRPERSRIRTNDSCTLGCLIICDTCVSAVFGESPASIPACLSGLPSITASMILRRLMSAMLLSLIACFLGCSVDFLDFGTTTVVFMGIIYSYIM